MNLLFTWNSNCAIVAGETVASAGSAVLDTRIYVPVVQLSYKENYKLSQQRNSKFNRKVYWNNYPFAKVTKIKLQYYLDYLFKFKFPGSKEAFVL